MTNRRASRPRAGFTGIFHDEFDPASGWLRETAILHLPAWDQPGDLPLRLVGNLQVHPQVSGCERGLPGLDCLIAGRCERHLTPTEPGPWVLELDFPQAALARGEPLQLVLRGVAWTNFLAWAGRITGHNGLQRFRRQHKNRQLRLLRLETTAGEVIFDFSHRYAALAAEFVHRHTRLGLNITGFLSADLGIGESARCMVRAADAAQLATALIPLQLPCKNTQSDRTYASRLQTTNPHPVNVVHLDPPAAYDLDRYHGATFRSGKYNIAYWAWELPEFPDAWVPACDYFQEIWVPSDFVRHAIATKVPLPVFTMPHAIAFARPTSPKRARFGLPDHRFLFLSLYDLNSYSVRKNPQAAIAAFRASGLATRGAGLVIKVHNQAGNEADAEALRAYVADLPQVILISETLSRTDVYELQAACDCFVSLHRSEGFGLAVAECMYLGKPVISTDWSATAEYLTPVNGCPVHYQLKTLERSYGPYPKGGTWAEADTDHAAWWMRRVFEDRALATGLGVEARTSIEGRFAPATIGARYRRRLQAIALF